jgi:CRISPR-associated protein Cas2
MLKKQFILVVYDISNDKRRTKLHKRLKDFGTPVQYSVFECIITSKEYDKMKKAVKKITKPRLDHVRYYPICANCREKIEIVGRHEVTSEADVYIA